MESKPKSNQGEAKPVPDLWRSPVLCACRVGPAGDLTACSPGLSAILSICDPPLPNLAQCLHPEDRDAFMERLSWVCSHDHCSERLSVRTQGRDGRIFSMEVSAEPCLVNDQPAGALLYWWERSLENYSTDWSSGDDTGLYHEIAMNFVANLPDPVLLLDIEGRITNFNPALQEMLGHHRSDLLGRPVAVIFAEFGGDLAKGMHYFSRLMRGGSAAKGPSLWQTSSGDTILVSMSCAPVRSNLGELIGVLVSGRDERDNALVRDLETKHRELEEAYRELKKLERMKDDVLSLVGHELRAPLSNILGYSEFLHQWNITDDERSEYTRIVFEESQNLKRLINDIMDLIKLEAGRMEYTFVLEDPNQVVRAAIGDLAGAASHKRVKIVFEADDQLEPIELDVDRVRQALDHLLHNAVKFSDRGGQVTVRTQAVEGAVRITVIDQGIGIEPHEAGRVFKRLEQILDVRHHGEGAGLGLSIVQRIIENGHSGKVWFESAGAGQGAAFLLTLPERREQS